MTVVDTQLYHLQEYVPVGCVECGTHLGYVTAGDYCDQIEADGSDNWYFCPVCLGIRE